MSQPTLTPSLQRDSQQEAFVGFKWNVILICVDVEKLSHELERGYTTEFEIAALNILDLHDISSESKGTY